jgi:hypothetical protein
MNANNICIHNILTKMGLSGTGDEMPMAWIERFFLKTSLLWRKKDESQPYRDAFPKEIVDLNLKFHKKLVSASDYNVRLIYGRVNVKEDPEMYIDDDERVFSWRHLSYGASRTNVSLTVRHTIFSRDCGRQP